MALVLNVYIVASNSRLNIYLYSLKLLENNLGDPAHFLAPLIWPAVSKLQNGTGQMGGWVSCSAVAVALWW